RGRRGYRGLPCLRRQRVHERADARRGRRFGLLDALAMAEVPLIDLGPARGIDEACREIGFFAIPGHGVADHLVAALRRRAHEFFELPMAEKLASRHPLAGTTRDYHPVGLEALSASKDEAAPPDLKEFFHVGPVDVRDD